MLSLSEPHELVRHDGGNCLVIRTAPGRIYAIKPLAANVVSAQGQTHDDEHGGFANTGPTQGEDAIVKQKRIQYGQEEISHEGLEAPRREREESGSSCTGLPSRLVLCHDADLRLRPACYGRAGVWLDVRKNPDVLLVLSIAIWGSLVYESDTFVKFISLRVPLRCFCALQTSAFGRDASR